MKHLSPSTFVVLSLLTASLASGQGAITFPQVSEAAAPCQTVEVPMPEGHQATFVMRKPPGEGPFPVLIHLHGGLGSRQTQKLANSLRGPTGSRFLAAGYVTAAATFRSRSHNPLTRDALEDCLAIIAHLKRLPEVDPKSVVVWGDSGGGSLALELAGETDLAAAVACEPATVLFTGMFSTDNLKGAPPYSAKSGMNIMADPRSFYTPELKTRTREKIARMRCPVLIAHGDQHPINKINNEVFVPEMKEMGKDLAVILYPGGGHSLSHAGKPEITLKFFNDTHAFFKKHLKAQPAPMPAALLIEAPVNNEAKRETRGREQLSPAIEGETQPDTARARQIFQKQRSGEKLSSAEEDELLRIRESMTKERAQKKSEPRGEKKRERARQIPPVPERIDSPPPNAPAETCLWNFPAPSNA